MSINSFCLPANLRELFEVPARYDNALGEEERPLGEQIPSVAAQFPAGGNDTMAGNRRITRFPHDVAHRSIGTWPPGGRRYIAVCRDTPMRDAPDD